MIDVEDETIELQIMVKFESQGQCDGEKFLFSVAEQVFAGVNLRLAYSRTLTRAILLDLQQGDAESQQGSIIFGFNW